MSTPLLEASAITKRFSGIVAVADVSVSVEHGELVAVIGPNGAGKSTLFNCLTGVLAPDTGTVLLGGRRIDRLAPAARSRLGIARTFQRLELFGAMTARDHCIVADRARSSRGARGGRRARPGGSLGTPAERRDTQSDLYDTRQERRGPRGDLGTAQDDLRDRWDQPIETRDRKRSRGPGLLRRGLLGDLLAGGAPTASELARSEEILDLVGLSAVADQPAESLSLGRGRLVELARALSCEPRLLFLDEPSSGLDRRETEEMAEALDSVRRNHGTAIMLIEHDVPMVQALASRTYVLDHGVLIAAGRTDEVMADDRVRTAYLGSGT